MVGRAANNCNLQVLPPAYLNVSYAFGSRLGVVESKQCHH